MLSITFTCRKLEPLFNAKAARQLPIKLINSVSYVAGQVLGEVTATPGTFKAYASGNSDGSETPKGLLAVDTTTNSSGEHFFGQQAASENGVVHRHTSAFFSGTFDTNDLTGLDANAVTKLGRLISGSVASGILQLV